jgi:hypothetical protein
MRLLYLRKHAFCSGLRLPPTHIRNTALSGPFESKSVASHTRREHSRGRDPGMIPNLWNRNHSKAHVEVGYFGNMAITSISIAM